LEDPLLASLRDSVPATQTHSQGHRDMPEQKWLEVGRVESSPADAAETTGDWREELSSRVQDYRKKKSKLKRGSNVPPESLELDFTGGLDEPVRFDESAERPDESPPYLELDLDDAGAPQLDRAVNLGKLQALERELSVGEANLESSEEVSPTLHGAPMEIVVGSSEAISSLEEQSLETALMAPVVRRFLAGLSDATVLVLGVSLFGVIFWRSGGHLSPNPLNFVVLAVMGIMEVFAYFALFTALSASTPGLLWLGCEIRNLQGDCPTTRESCWRAFGVLVSLSAFMLGFIWAWVDSDSLTWHDRMSGTFITLARP